MTSEEQTAIVAAIDESEARLQSLAERLRSRPHTPLVEGDWTVRDTLCHIAARANDVALVLGLAQQRTDTSPGAPMETDAINARQIAERTGRSVDELLQEAVDGYAAAREAVATLSADALAQVIPDVAGQGPMTIGDVLLLVYRSHAQGHIATLEAAFGTAPT
jgi:hypothetical protein